MTDDIVQLARRLDELERAQAKLQAERDQYRVLYQEMLERCRKLELGLRSHPAERIPDGALAFVYLLHPDPWPKARHAKRRMMNDGPVELIAAKLRPGGELRFGTDHPVYLRHALMVMRRHSDSFEWLVEGPRSWQVRPGGWPETRYERKARTVYGHEVWYFRYRRR